MCGVGRKGHSAFWLSECDKLDMCGGVWHKFHKFVDCFVIFGLVGESFSPRTSH